MYHPPSKRKQLARRVAVYSLMTVTVVGLVTTLVFVMLGYQFDKTRGTIEQGGLVQFDTAPDGASITIDGREFSSLTPSKTTLPAGDHFISMHKQGYHTWQKAVRLEAGSVLWLKYARLIPTQLASEHVAEFPAVSDALASPDRKIMALKEAPDSPVVRLADLGSQKVDVTSISIPKEAYEGAGAGRFDLVSWDADSRYLLVRHTAGGTVQWLVVDTKKPSATKNLSRDLDIALAQPRFSSDSKILYALSGHTLRRINMEAMTVSGAIVKNVESFSLSQDDIITYVSRQNTTAKQRSVGYLSKGASKGRTIRTFSGEGKETVQIARGVYFGDEHIAITRGKVMDILIGDLPRSDGNDALELRSVTTSALPERATYLAIRTSGRFVVAQHDRSFTVYDLELGRAATTALQGTEIAKRELRWIDNYMLWNDHGGSLRVMEFDGTNQHAIMSVVGGMDVTLSADENYLYGISKSDGTYHLSRVPMIVK